MPYIRTNDINLYYETHGKGYPLILISGLGGDRTFWQASMEALARHAEVITFDTRGIGRSDAPEAAYSMEQFADDVAGLMNALDIRQANMLGFSMGGQVALKFALKYPERLSKLILAATCSKLNTQIRLFVDAVLQVYEAGITPKQMFELIAPWLFSDRFLSAPGNEAFLQFDENDPESQPLYAWRNQYLAQRAFDCTSELANIRIAPLILSGALDVFAQPGDARILAANIPGAHLEMIEEAGHLFNFEQPEIFHRLILEHLQN